jgi:multidrug efflux system outer membrane protein
MSRKILLFFVVLLALFEGCSLAPEYTRPPSPVPDGWPTGEAYGTITAAETLPAAHETAWRELFADERLQAVIKMALNNNRNLRLAALNVEKARVLYGIQRAELLPAINAVGSGSKERVPADLSSTGKSMTEELYSVSLGVTSWEIDFFGRIRSLKDQALQEYLATEQGRRSAQISLISAVVEAYLTLAADSENLELARSTVDTQRSAYDLIKKRYDAGLATKVDLRQAQTQVDAARRDAALFTQLTAQDRNALNLLAGTQVPDDLLPPTLSEVGPLKIISPGLSSEVLLTRPDIMAAEHRLKGANASIGAARATLFPRIALTTSGGTASAELSDLFSAGSATWSFAPQITMPIFDVRAWRALTLSKAQQKILLTMYEKVIQEAFREVADVLAVRGTVDQRVSAQQSLVDAVAETLRLSKTRYTSGIDSYLSVLDAQRSLYGSQQELIALRLVELVSRVRLYAVLGGGA